MRNRGKGRNRRGEKWGKGEAKEHEEAHVRRTHVGNCKYIKRDDTDLGDT